MDLVWCQYDAAKVAKMWEYHRYCLQAAIDYHGGNNYPKHRPKEVKEALDAGLVSQADYDDVKRNYLRAKLKAIELQTKELQFTL